MMDSVPFVIYTRLTRIAVPNSDVTSNPVLF
jgi:hypothetical protein